jgi:hypothetical protein
LAAASSADAAEAAQRFVHLVGIARVRPGLGAHRGDRLGVEGAEVVGAFRVAPAPALHGLGPPLFQRCVVEEGVGRGAEHFRRQRRGRRQVARVEAHRAALHAPQQGQPGVAVHGLVQAVVEGLLDQRVVGNLPLADDVLQARSGREHRGDQVLAAHALQLRRHLAPPGSAAGPARSRRSSASARRTGRVEQGLHQHLLGALRFR